jgi:hypothetical protein
MECLKNMSFLLPLVAEAEVDILTFLLGEGVLAVKNPQNAQVCQQQID